MKPELSIRAYSMAPYLKQSEAKDDKSKNINAHLYALKDGRTIRYTDGTQASPLDFFANALAEEIEPWLQNTTLVAVPGSEVSAPVRTADKGVLFAQAIAKRFPGCVVEAGMRRIIEVPKSHRGAPKDRTTVQRHIETIEFKGSLDPSRLIVLVDDMFTKGTQTAAAAKILMNSGASNATFAPSLERTTASPMRRPNSTSSGGSSG